ncbi:MAG: eukaryotic-like serine/threonine-protein kinase, partial [Acidobacteriota bacterium]|nr:eukaryotic-like serine/threonine-protein kinase [Acidobacteriota bacterium]
MKTCPQCGGSYEPTLKFCPRDGQVLEDAPQEMVGQVLDGQYEIEAFVARGGMGSIFRARHILLGDRVALKMLRPEFRANPEWLRRFQREGQAARRFRHPNAVTVYDLRTSSDGLVYMVMEFVAGRSLDKELKQRGRFTPAGAFEALEPVAQVLEEAHEQGVVHRDLKPENVMIERKDDGELCVKLLDLGIAKLREIADAATSDNGAPLTVAGQVLGTPYYMSPEQWGEPQRDGSAEIDGRADIYSLAVMFYELIAGARPFDARTLAELHHAHAAVHPPRLDEVVPGVPASVARAVERGMAKDRNDRQPTAAVFLEELRAALDLPASISHAPRADEDAPTGTPEAARAASDTAKQGEAFETLDYAMRATHEEQSPAAQHVPAQPSSAQPPIASPSGASVSEQVVVLPAQGIAPQVGAEVAPARAASSAAPSFVSPPPVAPSFVSPGLPASQSARGAKGSRAPLIVLAGLVLVLLCGGIVGAGWFLWSRWQASRITMLGSPPAVAPEGQTEA